MLLVKTFMSFDEQVEERKDIDEYRRELKFRFDKETRKKISYIRDKYKRLIYNLCVEFYGLHFTTPTNLKKINELIKEADKEMKKINPELYAHLIVIPLSIDEIKKGKLYEQIYYTILYHCAKAILDHILKIKSEIPTKRTVKNLEKLLEHFKNLNVLNDSKINDKIEEFRTLIHLTRDEIKSRIMEELNYIEEELNKLLEV